jgi:retinol dehydrogenase 8
MTNDQNNVTVVTGASTGIGRAVALRQARAGDRVWGLVRTPRNCSDLTQLAESEGLDLRLVRADVCDDDSIEAAFAEIFKHSGRVNALVNNAGLFLGSTLEATSMDELCGMVEVNFLGAIRCIKQVLPAMRQNGGGVIASVTSQSTQAIFPTWAAYAGSKCALEGALESLAMEVREFGIRVAIVQPGITLTAMRGKIQPRSDPAAYDRLLKRYRTLIAADRTESMAADDVAQAIASVLADPMTPFRTRVGVDAVRNIALRESITDEQWVGLFGRVDDDDFYGAWVGLAGGRDPRARVDLD